MSFNVYPDQLRQILSLIEALDAHDKRMIEAKPDYPIGPGVVPLRGYEDETDWGKLQDEIGGAWSWTPPVSNTDTRDA